MSNQVKIERSSAGNYYVNIDGSWEGTIEKQSNQKWTINMNDYRESDVPTKRQAVAIVKANLI